MAALVYNVAVNTLKLEQRAPYCPVVAGCPGANAAAKLVREEP